jgi:hypothetical protein
VNVHLIAVEGALASQISQRRRYRPIDAVLRYLFCWRQDYLDLAKPT